ncbi:TrmH family RNA methyltransferase [Tamaricihabitans halophyticus]|uniref:TrmH family RNA methyltransferase n=1 Tax=Tamaricihabitans halophyticus TaxID=1262583 RepID=A0A4R2Q769_9PSEU|nr:RNA methyltransferase [Tamaricihabitans halophyticus]TCP44743.1 TrmH family RNA methyltransferase [Tamaricihabitans halophyticus]
MADQRPEADPFTERTPRVVAARRLTTRAGRDETGRFLVEGAQAISEALDWAATAPARMHELFVTERAANKHADLVRLAEQVGARISRITERAAAACSETVTPQGIVAVCAQPTVSLAQAISTGTAPRLVAVLVDIADPGNAGTVLRVADAAGADAVVFAGDTVDPHNGKCVRASTGSLFHLPVARCRDPEQAFSACRAAGLRLIGADGTAERTLDDAGELLTDRAAWVFGSEAHGLAASTRGQLDALLGVPLYGAAESLNLGTAAAVCLYASAMAQRATSTGAQPPTSRNIPGADHLGSSTIH